jgi:hypothetical protein
MNRCEIGQVPISLLLAGLVWFVSTAASANTISLVGDKDGSFLGAPFPDGVLWGSLGGVSFTDYRDAGDLATAPHTDLWSANAPVNPAAWTHTYVLDGTAVSANLQLNIAGFADIGSVDLLIDGALLTIFNFPGQNNTTHVLNVAVPLGNIDGSTAFNLVPSSGNDGYIIDFTELTIVTRSVPEPGSLTLLGLALAGLGFSRRHNLH